MFQPGVEFNQQLGGWIEVVCGPMFSGKTEELIRRMRRAQIAGQKVEIFKPVSDVRYDKEEVVSHDKNSIPSMPVESSSNMLLLADDVQVVGIDEAQFFDDGIVEVANTLANQGKRVVIAGLDKDFKGRPFGPMPQLLANSAACALSSRPTQCGRTHWRINGYCGIIRSAAFKRSGTFSFNVKAHALIYSRGSCTDI